MGIFLRGVCSTFVWDPFEQKRRFVKETPLFLSFCIYGKEKIVYTFTV